MRPLMFTREDFNVLLNFGDLRAAEFSLSCNGIAREAFEFTTNFISSQDLAVDYVSAAKVKRLVAEASSYQMRVARHHPWHEAFVDDAVVLSRRHLHAYTPVLVAARGEQVQQPRASAGLPVYLRRFAARTEPEVCTEPFISPNANGELLVFYRPDDRVQQEVLIRMFRQKAGRQTAASDQDFNLGDGLADRLAAHAPTSEDADLFNQVLLQLWPCGAYGRLSSYLYLKERRGPLAAELVTWNVQPSPEGLKTLTGELVPAVGEVGAALSRGGVRRHYSFIRCAETDRLALHGALAYRLDEGWRTRGWPVAASSLDPLVSVRSDGIYRWMTLPHGGLESIEALDTGTNHALGGDFIAREIGQRLGCRLLFAGLGLGVMQRQLASNRSITTVECNPAVVDIHERLALKRPGHEIIVGDFMTFLSRAEGVWDAVIVDLCDPDLAMVRPDSLASLAACTAPGGKIVVNHQGDLAAFRSAVDASAAATGSHAQVHDLGNSQAVAEIELANRGHASAVQKNRLASPI